MRSLDLVDSISKVDPVDWHALRGHSPLASYGWLRATEESLALPWQPGYVLVRDGGMLVAAAVFTRAQPTRQSFTLDHMAFGRLHAGAAQLGLSLLPAWLGGLRDSYGSQFLLHECLSGEERREVLDLLVERLEAGARQEDLPLAFPHVLEWETELRDVLARRGYLLTRYSPLCHLDIEWDSFDGYLKTLQRQRRDMRKKIRYELRRCRDSGVTIRELEDAEELSAPLFRLANRQMLRRGLRSLPYDSKLVLRAKQYLGRDALFYGAFRENRLVGFSMFLLRGRQAYARLFGLSDDEAKRDFTYFNLCYYEPIRDLTARGVQRIFYGAGPHLPKIRRGCRVCRVEVAYHPRSAWARALLRPAVAAHRAWFERKERAIERHAGARGEPS